MTMPEPHRDSPDASLFHRVRLRVFAVLVATVLAVVGAVSWAALPLWPVIGVAVATIAFAVNGMTSRLDQPVCWTCGADVSKQTAGEYGAICPECGTLNSHVKPAQPTSRKA
ncbi:MAG: hypothetical protein KF678_10205 [Phycisphaeraceae bacterium]|nr:hypothetical protein [Phycisphaeraceae bacterium]